MTSRWVFTSSPGRRTTVEPHPAPDLDGDLDPDGVAATAYLAGSCCSEVENSYTYSDMTGYQLSNVSEPLGDFRFFLPSCEEGTTTWGDIGVEGDFPAGTSLSMHVRLVAGLADLEGNDEWIELALEDGTPVLDASHPDGGVFVMPELEGLGTLGVRVTLRTEDQTRQVRPFVSQMWVDRACRWFDSVTSEAPGARGAPARSPHPPAPYPSNARDLACFSE